MARKKFKWIVGAIYEGEDALGQRVEFMCHSRVESRRPFGVILFGLERHRVYEDEVGDDMYKLVSLPVSLEEKGRIPAKRGRPRKTNTE